MASIWQDRIDVQHIGADGEIVTVTFNERDAMPLGGRWGGLVHWGIDTLDPWDSTSSRPGEFSAITAVDGEIPGDFFAAEGKTYLIGGYVNAGEDRELAEAAWDVIVRDAFPTNVDLTLSRYSVVPKYTVGRLVDVRDIKWVGPYMFRWSVQMRAYDPFRYSLTPMDASTGISGTLEGGRVYPRVYPLTYNMRNLGANNKIQFDVLGTVDTTRTVARLTGPLPEGGWRLINETTGAYLKVAMEIPTGSTLVIDFFDEAVLLDGEEVTAQITGEFFELRAGVVNTVKLISDYNAEATLQLTSYSAWE